MPDRARVLHVGSLPPPQGGIGTYIDGLMRSRVARAYAIDFLEVGVAPLFRRYRALRPLQSLRSIVRLRQQLRRTRPDLVHVHVADFPGFWEKAAFARIASRGGIPTVLHLHGGSLDRSLRRLSGLRARWVSRVLAGATAVVSPAIAWRPFLERFAAAERIVVLPNAIHPADFERRVATGANGIAAHADVAGAAAHAPGVTAHEDPVGAVARATGIDTAGCGPVRLLFLGMLSPRKGLDELLVALHGHEDIHLDIVGGEEVAGAIEHYRRRFHAAGLGPRVTFHGERVGDEKLRFLHAADIFVLPSRSESFGIANLEAMACGLAIVTTRTGAVPEYLENEVQALLVDPGDSTALAAALRRLIEDPGLRHRLGKAALRRVQDFGWDVVGEQVEGLYARCLAAARRT